MPRPFRPAVLLFLLAQTAASGAFAQELDDGSRAITPRQFASSRDYAAITHQGGAFDPQTAGSEALVYASAGGNDRLVSTLIGNGLSPNGPDRSGETPLVAAVRAEQGQIVRLLLARGVDVEQRGQGGLSALGVAAMRGNLGIAKQLLAAGAPIDGRDATRATPLMLAATTGRYEMVAFLISRGAALDLKDANGMRPLELALAAYHTPTALLINNAEAAAEAANAAP